jgi:hypothetical protein
MIILNLIGVVSIGVLLMVMGLLSRRMGKATQAAPYYIGFFIAGVLVLGGVIARVANPDVDLTQNGLAVMLYNGLPAIGLTLGAAIAWHYWSWLLAERE